MTAFLLSCKGHVARTSGVRCQLSCGTYFIMEDPTSPTAVARRLRAIMLDARLPDVQALADLAGAERNAVSNWLNGYNLPPVNKAAKLADELKLNLDWLYRGVADHLPMATGIRLTALVERLANQAQSNEPAALGAAQGAKRGRPRKKVPASD